LVPVLAVLARAMCDGQKTHALPLLLVGWRLCADFGHGASNWSFDPK
jgi:hypothetical protein